MSSERYDVAIIGGGLAGVLLARQLRRQVPDAQVAIFEKATAPSAKVGESTVELASNYLIRRLGLSSYLYERHLPKNGLRFFFDDSERSAELSSMSEIGSVAMPYLPSFQIDRARFEADLWAMNEGDGVASHRSKVSRLRIRDSLGDGEHEFEIEDPMHGRGAGRRTIRARWVVDATGRAGMIAGQQSLRVNESHAMSAVWGRFEGVVDIDGCGNEAFRGRVNHTSRMLSTNHFCYPGYWIWFIPLRNGLTSVGVVMESERFDKRWRGGSEFETFLRSHRAVRDLLDGARRVDVMSLGQLAYGSSRYFSEHRWAVIGDAASFTDPFYSPGSDLTAIENDFVTELVRRDLAQEDPGTLAALTSKFDEVMRFRHETTMMIYRGQYGLLGSYDLYRLKWDFDIACYYNLWLEPYMRDAHLNPDWIRGHLRQRRFVNAVMKNFSSLFARVEAHLEATKGYRAHNLGAFTGAFPTMRCAEGLGSESSSKASMERTAEAFNLTRRRALTLLGHQNVQDLPLTHYLTGRPLL